MIDPPPPLYAPGEEASYDDGDVEESLVLFNSMEEMMNASTPSPFYSWPSPFPRPNPHPPNSKKKKSVLRG